MKSLTLCVLLLVAVTTAQPTDECLSCMCFVSSSGCSMPEPVCQNNGWGEVCGPWAITLAYWMDGGYQDGDFYTCVESWECNERTVRAYLDRWVSSPYADCQYYARTHVGGPSGPSQEWTLAYWNQVKYCLDNALITPPSDI